MWKPLVLGAAFVTMSATAMAAPQQCNTRENVLDLLSSKYSESPVAFGVTNNGGLVEVLKSTSAAKEDTWTIIVTTPKGVSCLVAAGEGWKPIDQIAVDPET